MGPHPSAAATSACKFGRIAPDMDPTLDPLLADVDLLCLDAGNTVVFFDHARLAHACRLAGHSTTVAALVAAEGKTKVALDQGRLHECSWSHSHVASARGWGKVMATMVLRAGLAAEQIPSLLDTLWPAHLARNLWSLVPDGLTAALDRVRAGGVRVAIVSNSEGKLTEQLEGLGVLGSLDLVVDSGVLGIEKPDPRIFRVALERFDVPPERALHLGDTFGTDVVGARAAGVRVALVDPHRHLEGHYTDVPRVPGAREVAHALAEARDG
jgi:putative hydrolase of the HAD superfamily